MKYIILDAPYRDGLRCRVPIVFSEYLIHAEVASAIQRCTDMRLSKPVSAGFCSQDVACFDGWKCYGKSESLGVKADPIEDAETLTYLSSNTPQLYDPKDAP